MTRLPQAALLILLLGSEVARAQDLEPTAPGDPDVEMLASDWDYPKAIGRRPLTMQKFMARGNFSIDVRKVGERSVVGDNEVQAALDFGAAFSPFENVEVGISNYRLASPPPIPAQGFFPIQVAPTGAFGDMPAYVRYRFLARPKYELAFDFVFVIPSGTRLAITAGGPARIFVNSKLTIDTGLDCTFLVADAGANLVLPFRATYNFTPAGFLFGDSGLSFENLGRNNVNVIASPESFGDSNVAFPVAKNQVFIPIGLGGGYTFAVQDKVVIDIYGRFGWNPFVYLNPPSGVNVVPITDTWVLSVGIVVQSRRVLDPKPGDT